MTFKKFKTESFLGGKFESSEEELDLGPEMQKGFIQDVFMYTFDQSNLLNISAVVIELYNFSKKFGKIVIVRLGDEMIEIDAASGSKQFVLMLARKKIHDYITRKNKQK